ncbi:MAG: LacI family DNA-binding transcriptional regulator [Nocardioides sp.]
MVQSSAEVAHPGRSTGQVPTLADVADAAGVSRQTVSNAINNPDLLRQDTLERVQQAIESLGYSPNRAARNLRTQSSQLIGLRFAPAEEGTANALMDRFVHTLTEAAQEAGYHVLLFVGDPQDPEVGYEELIRSHSVDAFVVTDTYLGNPQTEWLRQRNFPFVAFGRPWNDPASTHPWVDVDGAAGAEQATHHLIDRGHTQIAFLGWSATSSVGEDRHTGWLRAMAQRGLPVDGRYRQTEDTVEAGAAVAAELLDHGVTGFVCASDTLGMGVLHTLWHRQLAPGREVGVVGFDDSQVAQVVQPGLTSVRQPLEEVAREVVRAVEALIRRDPVEPTGVLLPPTLVVRGSS